MLSLIIPVHNEVSVIAKQLQTIRKQLTDFPYEIIISDDNSSDNTVAEASPYADQVIANPSSTTTTISATRNRGGRLARYPYLVFIDSGVDIPEINHFFGTLLQCFKINPQLVAVSVNIRFFPTVETWLDKVILISLNTYFRLVNNVFKSGVAIGKFQMVTRNAFEKVAGYNEKIVASEDYDFFRRLSKIGRTRIEPTLAAYYSGRRPHQVGWFRLLPIWIINGIWVLLFNHSLSKKWESIR